MPIWSAEIKELEKLYDSFKGQLPELEKELEQLIHFDDPNVILLYSRRCLEVIVTDLCECELKRPRKTEPLKGIIDKLHKEEKVPSNIITSMDHLNSLSAYGTHPKDFDPEQVKPVLVNLDIIIKWYLKYKETKINPNTKVEGVKDDITAPEYTIKQNQKPKKRLVLLLSVLTLVVAIVIVALFVFDIIGGGKQTKELGKSIAVLPFENMSENVEHNWFGDAMTDEIIMQLYKINELIVRSRTSIKQYKTTEKTSPVIGQELDVNYLVEGSAQRFEDKIRIRVQLIQAATDNHLWGEIYEGNWEDILSLQSEIAKQIASELKTVLTAEEIEKIEKEPTMNLKAYELYLKAQYFQNSRDAEGILKSIHYYQDAIRLDANYAIAYCGLAYSYFLLSYYDILPKNEVLPRIKEAATKALELDNQLGEAHFSLALARELEGDLVGAEGEYLFVIKLNPNHAEVHHRYSYILAWLGKNNEAIKEAQIAYALEPSNPVMPRGLGYVYFLNQQFDLAIAECNKCIQIDPKQSFAYAILFWTYNQKSLHDDALTALEKLLIIREKEDIAALVRQTYEDSGYIKAIKTLLDVSKTQSIPWVSDPKLISGEIFNDLPKK